MFLSLLIASAMHAQKYQPLDPANPIKFDGKCITYKSQTIVLGAKAFFVDARLDEAQCKSPYVFRSINEAFRHLTSGTEQNPMKVYIAPYVYWVDNPDDSHIRMPKAGESIPFGLETDCSWLALYGLCDDPKNVVLASNLGQTQGAVGDYTMLKFTGDGLHLENLTLGNYCNVDLIYPLLPALNRVKRTATVTQAQIAFALGDKNFAKNCRFVSRLNACPLNGGTRVLLDSCYIECGDDALPSATVFYRCKMELYSSRPFYNTTEAGVVFLNCDFNIYTDGVQCLTKAGGQVAVIDSRITFQNNVKQLRWTGDKQDIQSCYEANNTSESRPFNIDANYPWTSVDIQNDQVLKAYRIDKNGKTIYNIYNLLRGNDGWNPLKQTLVKSDIPLSLKLMPMYAKIETGRKSVTIKVSQLRFSDIVCNNAPVTWTVIDNNKNVLLKNESDTSVMVVGNNLGEKSQLIRIEATTPSGLKASAFVTVKPSYLPAPEFQKKPVVRIGRGMAKVDYILALNGRADESLITWYRCTDRKGANPIPVAISRLGKPKTTYALTQDDEGYYLMVSVAPKHLRCHEGKPESTISSKKISKKNVLVTSSLSTDFRTFPTDYQPKVIPGFWTLDGNKPSDTNAFDWTPMPNFKKMWYYGKGFDGATGYGLLQVDKGARLRYTPKIGRYGDMSLTINVSPEKTAGQGFGSATGQYLDIGIKFDTETLTGYALRIVRTTKSDHAVDFLLMKYKNGIATPISLPVTSTCYRTDCTISIQLKGNQLTAHAQTNANIGSSTELRVVPVVNLQATVESNDFGGVYFQHTGSAGASATMFNWLKIQW